MGSRREKRREFNARVLVLVALAVLGTRSAQTGDY